jgi:hypothetical protein
MRKCGSYCISKMLSLSDGTGFPESIDPMQENVDNLKEEADT